MGANLLSAAERESISDDKFVHITAGYYHLADGDFYMNRLASARPHWRYLSDSNVEWGDDVKAPAEYLKARGRGRACAGPSSEIPSTSTALNGARRRSWPGSFDAA